MEATRIKKYMLSALLAVTLSACNMFATPVNTGEKILSELTKTLQPICVGRLVVEIPSVAYITNDWGQQIVDTEIESISPPSLNQKAFDTKVNQRETLLKTSPHNTDNVLLKVKIQLSPESILFVYREDRSVNTRYKFEALYWRSGVEYLFKTGATNKYFNEALEEISTVAKSFIAMPTTDLISLPPGLCIEHGVITGSEFRSESISVSGRIDEYPGLGFSFSMYSASLPPEPPSMIQRIEESFGMGDELGKRLTAATRFVRKGKRKLNGQLGEEMVLVATINGVTHMDADAEFYAELNVLDKPLIQISLSNPSHDINTRQPFSKTLTEKEFLALWDSLLNGIKPRPKNTWGGDSVQK